MFQSRQAEHRAHGCALGSAGTVFAELLSLERWLEIDREHSKRYGKGLNAINHQVLHFPWL